MPLALITASSESELSVVRANVTPISTDNGSTIMIRIGNR